MLLLGEVVIDLFLCGIVDGRLARSAGDLNRQTSWPWRNVLVRIEIERGNLRWR
jgi:hypothetical protein